MIFDFLTFAGGFGSTSKYCLFGCCFYSYLYLSGNIGWVILKSVWPMVVIHRPHGEGVGLGAGAGDPVPRWPPQQRELCEVLRGSAHLLLCVFLLHQGVLEQGFENGVNGVSYRFFPCRCQSFYWNVRQLVLCIVIPSIIFLFHSHHSHCTITDLFYLFTFISSRLNTSFLTFTPHIYFPSRFFCHLPPNTLISSFYPLKSFPFPSLPHLPCSILFLPSSPSKQNPSHIFPTLSLSMHHPPHTLLTPPLVHRSGTSEKTLPVALVP